MAVQHGKNATAAGILLGVGLGGFIDGIVLHQILQWHHMLSHRAPPDTLSAMRLNMLWDGIFHAAVWLATLAGVLLLWHAARRGEPVAPFRRLCGQMIFGWGMFNFVEGAIDHHLLELHYVREVADYAVYNHAFLALGVLQIALGLVWMRDARRRGLRFG